MAAPQFSSEPPLPAIMATHDERDSRPSAPGRLAGGSEVTVGTVLHVHHSPVKGMLVVIPGHGYMCEKFG
jgi:hypothetical protein